MKLTVDASVVVKWYVSESYSEEARLLLAHRLERFAPDILLAEYANVIWRKIRQNEITSPLEYFRELPRLQEAVAFLPVADLIERAAQLAVQISHPVYDCLYLACAEATDSTLITADQSLENKVARDSLNIDIRQIGAHDVANEISAAATALVIKRDKIEELVGACDRLLATEETIRSSADRPLNAKDMSRIFDSPTGRRLESLFYGLNDEERIDLLALGWLGQGYSGTEWKPIFERACTMIDGYANDNWVYVLGLGVYWRAGYERLTGISIAAASHF